MQTGTKKDARVIGKKDVITLGVFFAVFIVFGLIMPIRVLPGGAFFQIAFGSGGGAGGSAGDGGSAGSCGGGSAGCGGDGGSASGGDGSASGDSGGPADTCVASQGTACSDSNACSSTSGTIQCDGSCGAGAAPALPSGYGNSCTSAANSCGQTNSGTIQCNGTCSAGTPSNAACAGAACTSSPNSCGATNGTYNASGTCVPPANPAGYGNSCTSAANSCGQTNTGSIQCNGSCSVGVPANPAGYGSSCSSAPNACGQTNSGTVQCNGSCSASAPSSSTCVPSNPTLSALYQNGVYLGPSAPAYDPSGYQLSANATSPSGSNLNYYFEWSPTETAQWSGWTGSGGWGSVTHYVDYAAGTYYVRAWTYDANGNWSLLPSDWMTITLTTAAPTVSCVGTPGNPYVGQPVTWTSTVSGGSRSYSYAWSGDVSGSTPSVSSTYSSIGQKSAALIVTDTRTGFTGSATCATGTAQPNGPTNGGTCPSGVCPGTCTASLSADPYTVDQGQNTSLTWSVTGGSLCAASCTGSGFATGDAISGTAQATVPPAPPTTSYALTCTAGTYGPPPPVNTTVSVLIPTVTITANGQLTSTRVNGTTANNTTIAWSSEHATSCSVTRTPSATGWPKSGLSSSGTIDSVTAQTVYGIDCVNSAGTHVTGSVIVNVIASFNEF